MNSLSWLIYLAGVSDNLSGLFAFLAVVSGIGTILLSIYHACLLNEYFHDRRSYGKDDGTRPWLGYPVMAGIAFFVFAISPTLLPSKDTVLAIAASQAGEQVLKTPMAAKAEAAVESWLDAQTVANKAKVAEKEGK